MPVSIADTVSPSWDLLTDIQILLHYHFMQNAYLAGTLVALTAGIMGYEQYCSSCLSADLPYHSCNALLVS